MELNDLQWTSLLHLPCITGSIAANPNPIPCANTKGTTIAWETNDPLGAEVRVSIPGQPDKLFGRGHKGSVAVEWITAANLYRFDLYGLTQRELCLGHVIVRRKDESLPGLLAQLTAETGSGTADLDQLARFVANAAPRCVQSARFPEFFRLWEQCGVHITPVHFYQPIPDTRTLPESVWNCPSELPGIDMNDAVQLDLLCNCFPRFRDDYEKLPITADHPGEFCLLNGCFDGTDALVTYCMIRHFKPQMIIEVGGGYSSLVSGQAAARHAQSPLICIEPFPPDFLLKGVPGMRSLIQKKVEDVELEFFSQLQSGDILFIDSSHTVKIGGDVNYLFLEVLPRLRPGVIVHVHDIFFPLDYRRDWVLDEFRFWTEQYLLQAFLAFNSDFEALLCNNYLAYRYLDHFKATFPSSPWWGGGSFWMRRKLAANRNRS